MAGLSATRTKASATAARSAARSTSPSSSIRTRDPPIGFDQKNKTFPAAGGGGGNFDSLRKARKVEDGGRVIQEPGNRTIFKDKNNRLVIQHDDNERLRRVAPNARFEKGKGGNNISIIDRGKYKVYSETDSKGQLIRRYRRGPDGRDVYIIDNRRRHNGVGKGIAVGVGIGIGAAILGSLIDVPEPPRPHPTRQVHRRL